MAADSTPPEETDPDVDRLPDASEADARREVDEPQDRKQHGRVLTFLYSCIRELRRVDWPDRRHTFQATAVVLGFVVIAGSFLGLMDLIWQPLVEALL